IVEQVPTRLDLFEVLVPGLRIHRHHHVDAAAPAAPAGRVDADFEPRWQALDVRRKNIARCDRNAHAQDGLGEQQVRRRRPGAVDVGELDDEVVDGLDWADRRLHSAALAIGALGAPTAFAYGW